MPDPRFPDVPDTEGVPPVLRSAEDVPPVKPLTGDSVTPIASQGPQWGIFTSLGGVVLHVDNIAAFDLRREYVLSDYPIENSQFESYNKVARPYDISVVVTKGGKDTDRLSFQNDLERLIASIDFYSVITPDATYYPINPVGYTMRRTAENGVTLLTAEIQCKQIRVTATVAFTNSKEASGAATVNDGPVQTTAPPADTGAPK